MPEYDSRALYEKLVLDGFQAGLSWITILRKRENFRKAFHNFDPHKIARYGDRDVERLLKNDGIIRSRAKIDATIKGARLWLEMEEKQAGGFAELIWSHVDGKPKTNRFKTRDAVPDSGDIHRALLAYVSDMSLLDTSLLPHGKSIFSDVQVASLDHAMWFHRPFRVDDWLLYAQDSPSASGGRGFNRGALYTRDGRLVASVAQEGLIRSRRR